MERLGNQRPRARSALQVDGASAAVAGPATATRPSAGAAAGTPALAADLACWLAAVAVYVLAGWRALFHISGDALIHFVYAEHAAAGHWFQFNLGEISAGTTSAAYTTALALLVRLVGLTPAVYVTCAACIAAVLVVLWRVQRTTSALTGSSAWAALATTAIAANPGFAYNSALGIEAPFFTLAAAVLVLRDPAWATGRVLARGALAAAVAGACAVALRPEGALVLGVSVLVLAAGRRPGSERVGVTGPLVVAAAAGAAALALVALWQWHWTGTLIPTSGVSRLMLARREGVRLAGGLWVYPRFPVRLATYAPLVAATLAAPWLMGAGPPDRAPAAREIGRQGAAMLLAATLLYTFVTGAAHTARYVMFLVPIMAVTTALVLQQWQRAHRARWVPALAALALLGSYGGEAVLRSRERTQATNASVADVAHMVASRTATTDHWIAAAGFNEERCGRMRIVFSEVQVALGFDDRVRVVSADGRTWPLGTAELYRGDGTVDAARWIATLRPNVMAERPVDPALDAGLDACDRAGAPTCLFGEVTWHKRLSAGLTTWVDTACER